MDRIVALDPGKMTGWAIYQKSDTTPEAVQAGEHPWYESIRWYEDLLIAGLPFVTVVERYTVTAATLKKTRQYWSLEAIGAYRYLARKHGQEILLQAPADAKNFATRDKLEKLGWWKPGSDHAQDALRHLLLYCTRENIIDLRRLV